jgi:hypothetical protein
MKAVVFKFATSNAFITYCPEDMLHEINHTKLLSFLELEINSKFDNVLEISGTMEGRIDIVDGKISIKFINEFFEAEVVYEVYDFSNWELPQVQYHTALQNALLQLLKDHPEFLEEHTTGNDMIEILYQIRDSFATGFHFNQKEQPNIILENDSTAF